MWSRKMSFLDFWRSQKERGDLVKRARELRLDTSQLKRLHHDDAIRAQLQNARMSSLLPPVGTEVFRRFTPASLEDVQHHGIQHQEMAKKEPKQTAHLEAGKTLPFVYGDPPLDLLNMPLEELDPAYRSQKTFIVLSKGNIIHRFNAESACYLLSPFSLMRTTAIRLLTHSLFILMTIVTNCVFMMISDPPSWSRTVGYFFTTIYMFEVFIKIMSRGFCVGRFTFLRDPWNWLDVVVVITALLSEVVDLGKVSVLMTVSRALKMISVCPGVKTTAGVVVQSVKRLAAVSIFTLSVLCTFALIGLQLYMGILGHKCVLGWNNNLTSWMELVSDDDYGTWSQFNYYKYISSPENYYYPPGHTDALICGNRSDAGDCPEGFSCLGTDRNPDFGSTSYDSFGLSLLAVVRLFYQDFWEHLFQQMLLAEGKISVIFLPLVFAGSFCCMSLILAVVVMATVVQEKAVVEDAKQNEEEFTDIVKVIQMREVEEQTSCSVEFSGKHDSAGQRNSLMKSQDHPAEVQEDQTSCPPCCLALVKWKCCGCWSWLKQRIHTLVTNPYFDLMIVVCLILNTFFLAMVHFPMTYKFEEILIISSLVFTVIFTAEMLLRLVAMGTCSYFQVGWNIYDSIVVGFSLASLLIADFEDFTLLRVLRLARWWQSLRMLLKMMWTSVGALRNVTLILLITVFIFTVVGMQLFHDDYKDHVCLIATDCQLPRWHMHQLFHTFLLIFRILCGEWIETLWHCMEVSGQSKCLVFFLTFLVIGQLLALYLFLSLLLTPLSSNNLSSPTKIGENNVKIAIDGIRVWVLEHTCALFRKDQDNNKKEYMGLTFVTSEQPMSKATTLTGNCLTSNDANTAIRRAPVTEAETDFKKLEKEEEKHWDEGNDCHQENTPEDCCCYNTSPATARVWSNFRRACFTIVQHRYFEAFIIFIILLSSAALVFEDMYLEQRQVLQMVLDRADQVFTFLFLLEMLLKWIGYGFKKYFTDAGCCLDFLILAVSLMSLTLGMFGISELSAGLSLRTLRTLRPLRALSRFRGLRVVLKALAVTFPYMCDSLLVCAFVWLIFNIVGVYMFSGKFARCLNASSQEVFPGDVVNNRSECLLLIEQNFTEVRWENPKINFDSVGAGYLSLLQVATCMGWLQIMYAAVDSTQVESQPVYESNVSMYLYFICFIIIGRFFIFNMFIRFFINALDQQRHKFGGKSVFMTDDQWKCSRSMKKWFSKKPVPRPQNRCQTLLFDLVTKQSFEVVMAVLICLNMVPLMVETTQQSIEKEFYLYWVYTIFIIIFFTEFLLKIIGLRQHYFYDCFNILDFIVILASIINVFLGDLMYMYFTSGSWLPILRLSRVGRLILRTRCARGIRRLLFAFVRSLPALFNICLLIFLLMFTFSIFGMFTFAHVKKEAMVNKVLNFETFLNSMMSMFVVTTAAGWDALLKPLLNTPPDCHPNMEIPGSTVRGDCSSPVMGIIFVTSYVSVTRLLVVLMYITVILEVFSVDDTEHLSDSDLQMFYRSWRKFDPDASQVIRYSQLSDFCDTLQDPLRIPKPNTVQLIHMDLPLLPGDMIHWMDILRALTTQVLDDPREMETLKVRIEEKFMTKISYEPISSTLKRKQEEVAAAVIQKAYRKHLVERKDTQEPKAGGISAV